MREKVIESYLRKEVEKTGGRAVKLTSSNNRGLPDRICLFPGGGVVFVEVKAPGRKVTEGSLQQKQITWLKENGHLAVVIDSRPRVDAFIRWVRKSILVSD